MGDEEIGNLKMNPDGTFTVTVDNTGGETILDWNGTTSNTDTLQIDPSYWTSTDSSFKIYDPLYVSIDENHLEDATKEDLLELVKHLACREGYRISLDANNSDNTEIIEKLSKYFIVDKSDVKNPKEIFELNKRGLKVK